MTRRRHGILACPSCRLWRPWHSNQERPKIDRHCIKCGKRIRVQLDRDPRGSRSWMHSQGRGRHRVVELKELPDALLEGLLEVFEVAEMGGGWPAALQEDVECRY